MIWIALQEVGLVNAGKSETDKLRVHAICVAIFLAVGHIAMIFGILDPAILGFTPPGQAATQVSAGIATQQCAKPRAHSPQPGSWSAPAAATPVLSQPW